MNTLGVIAMIGCLPCVIFLFSTLPGRRAVVVSFIFAWLFLPIGGFKVPMLPPYTKMTAASLGAIIGVVLFDSGRLRRFRPNWIDLPFLFWAIAKICSSVSNGYGWYDGLSFVEALLIIWGLPWFLGRIYLSDLEGMRELCVGIAIGGLLYVPLCLFEVRMSPVLRVWVYGIPFYDWVESRRFGGWRPTVFMQHGLMLGMWMCMSALITWWLWAAKSVKRIWRFAPKTAALVSLGTAVLCKSFGALALLAVGIVSLWTSQKVHRSLPILLIVAFVPMYMTLRLSGAWSGGGLLELSAQVAGPDRAESLQSRLNSEDQFIRAGWHKPLFGFRGWYNTTGLQDKDEKAAIPDALWMIEFTAAGIVGLASLTAILILPSARVMSQMRPEHWKIPVLLPAVGLAMMVVLSMVDNLFNAMLNPIFILSAGALSGWSVQGTVQKCRMDSQRRMRLAKPVQVPGALANLRLKKHSNPTTN